MTTSPGKKGGLGCLGGCLLAVLPAAFVAGVVFLFWLNPDWLDEAASWRGPILAEDQLDPPPPASLPPPFALREKTPPPDDGSFPLDLGGLPEVERVSNTVFAAQGGEVRLSDGTGVILPPGALPGDRQVTVRRLGGDEPALSMLSVVDVDAGGAELSADATVVLPVPPGLPAMQGFKLVSRALHVHDGRAVEIPIVSGPDGGKVTVRTRRFSLLTVALVVVASEAWYMDVAYMREKLYDYLEFSRRDPPLPVPYLSQGNSNWCFAAATAMLVHAHGGNESPSEVASHFRVEFLTAMSNPQGYWIGGLGRFMSAYRPLQDNAPWMNPAAAALHICGHLEEGRPVYVDIFQCQHAVVAVGFNRDGIYLHDPAGTALFYAGFTDLRDRLKDGRLAAVFVPWEKFLALSCTAGGRIPKPIYTMVFQTPLSGKAPVSVEVMHDGLAFVHPTPAPYPQKNPWLVNFAWDGRMFRGQTFQLVKQDPLWDDRGGWLATGNVNAFPNHPCNGDKISLRAVVATPVPPPGPITVQAFLEDQPIGPARAVSVPSAGPDTRYLANIQADLTPLKGDDLPVRLMPGPNKLRVEVRAGGALTDTEEITASFGPSRPANVRLSPRPEGGTDLEWDAVPEYGVEYKVRLAEKVLSWGRELATTADTRWEVPGELLERTDPAWLYVQAVHTNSGLESVPSNHLCLRDPWEGRWKGKIKLVEGALFETGDYLLDRYVQAMLESENKDEQKIQERLSGATPEAAGRIQQELNEHRESTRKTSEFLNAVKEYLSSLLLIVDFGARAGIPMTFDLTRKAESVYEMRLVQLGGLKPEKPEPMDMLAAGPHTLGVYELEMLTEDQLSKEIRLNPLPRLKLRRWNGCRGDSVISFEMKGKTEFLIFKWEFERA